MSFQVDGVCYSTAYASVQAMAAREVGKIIQLGSSGYAVDVSAITDASITFSLTPLTGGASIVKSVPVLPIECGLLDTSDALVISWAIASAWLATAALLYIRRGLHT